MATPYLTPAQVRAGVGATLSDDGRYPDEAIVDAIAEFEEIAEQYRGCAFTPRERVYTVRTQCRPGNLVVLPDMFVTEITAATRDGDEFDVEDLTLNDGTVVLTQSGPWVLTYTYGYETPPQLILAACREYVKASLLRSKSGISPETIAQSADGATFSTYTPDPSAGRPTGYRDVDRRLNMLPDLRLPGVG